MLIKRKEVIMGPRKPEPKSEYTKDELFASMGYEQ